MSVSTTPSTVKPGCVMVTFAVIVCIIGILSYFIG